MEKHTLGRSKLEVSSLCLGGGVFGWTADAYSRWVPGHQGGESESIIGKWLKLRGNREQMVISTKGGGINSPIGKGLSHKQIPQAVEASLSRLRTDYIDLYQPHTDDETTPLEETLATYADLIRQGKVRVLGASNYSQPRLEQALQISQQHGYPRFESLQTRYNLYDRVDYEQVFESFCKEHELGVITWYALASGFLTGKYRSERHLAAYTRGSFVKDYMNERGFRILNAIDQVAQSYAATPTQVALAWVATRRSITAPIASATSVQQLNQLIVGTGLRLDAPSIEILDQASIYPGKRRSGRLPGSSD